MSTDIMSHDQAVSSQAAERYVLGELTSSERDAFEGHFFDCAVCFEQVELGAQFLGRAREVLDREPEPGWLAGMLGDLRRPAPVFVSAMLLCAIAIGVHQQSVITDARRPRVEAGFFVPSDAKGAAKSIRVSRKSQLSLTTDFKPGSEFQSYRAQIVAESGKVEYSFPVIANDAGYSITIGLPATALPAGTYRLEIQGLTRDGAAKDVGHGVFELQFVD